MFKILGEISNLSSEEIGVKAYNLYTLKELDINIPTTYCLPNRYCAEFIKKNNLENLIIDIINSTDYHEMEIKYKKILKLERTLKIPFDILNFINEMTNREGKILWVVRSSSTFEDTFSASFAGMYKSMIGIPSDVRILGKALRKVWLFSFSHSLISYMRDFLGLSAEKISKIIFQGIAVIFQKLVFSEKSGIIFSRSPMDSSNFASFFECVWGLSEPLTSGWVLKESFFYDGREKIVKSSEEQRIGFFAINKMMNLLPGDSVDLIVDGKDRKFSYFKNRSKYIYILRLPQELWDLPVLNPSEISKIYNFLRKYRRMNGSNHFEAEWTIENKSVYFLQVRPITAHGKKLNNATSTNFDEKLHGLGVSPGKVSGEITYLKELEEDQKNIPKDSILVVHEITPQILSYYSKVEGIISELGTILCHGAILCRELGIPCVVLPQATKLLQFVRRVSIDGSKGEVMIIE